MSNILGLDIGTNSIGWALLERGERSKIRAVGSRIVPLGDDKAAFEAGKKVTRNATRRLARTARRNNKRYKQRRNKLMYVLHRLGLLPASVHFGYIEPETGEKRDGKFPPANKLQQLVVEPIKRGTLQKTAKEIQTLMRDALQRPVSAAEFGRLLYLFNQKRGYAGGGDEDDRGTDDEMERDERILRARIIKVTVKEKDESTARGKASFEVTIQPLDAEDEEPIAFTSRSNFYRQFLDKNLLDDEVVKDFKLVFENGKVKFGSTISKADWRNALEALEKELTQRERETGKPFYVSQYFLEKLEKNRWFRVRNNIVLRSRYQRQFDAIWEVQTGPGGPLAEVAPEVLNEIAAYLYPGPSETQQKLREDAVSNGIRHLIRDHIVFYQRPLRAQEDLIGRCQFEPGEPVIPRSHPLFQEYRIWQQVANLSYDKKSTVAEKVSYTTHGLTGAQKAAMFDKLHIQKEVSFGAVYKDLKLKKDVDYLHGLHVKKTLKGAETVLTLQKIFGAPLFGLLFPKASANRATDDELFVSLWRQLFEKIGNEYDPDSERVRSIRELLSSALAKDPSAAADLDELCLKLAKLKFKREYGSLSEKALRNILPLMRSGHYFREEDVPLEAAARRVALDDAIPDPEIDNALREYHADPIHCATLREGGMMAWAAAALMYRKHTGPEISDEDTYADAADIQPLPAHSLRNPVVEQIVNETLQVVKEIWWRYKVKPEEIRVELARDLKNNAEERRKMTEANIRREKTNRRVKERLKELEEAATMANIERYKLWDDCATEPAPKLSKTPTPAEVQRYKAWEEQKHLSPYTGNPIPLSRLFTSDYQIDHIIPRQRFFDDSFSNKVVCEAHINADKDNRTALEYINQGSARYQIKNPADYEEHVRSIFRGRKLKNLLAKKVPEDFVERQKKDTQYIAVRVREELAKIVGSAKVSTTTGGITDYLRQHWGLNQMMKRLTRDRYELMGLMTGEGRENWAHIRPTLRENGREHEDLVLKGWSKRLDNRHHAVDALVIACTNAAHVQRLNNLHKALQERVDAKREEILKLRQPEEGETLLEAFLQLKPEQKKVLLGELGSLKAFDHPWPGFMAEAEACIRNTVVSYKVKQRLLLQRPEAADETPRLKIRSKLHQDTVYGARSVDETKDVRLASAFDLVNYVDDPAIKAAIEQRIRDFGDDVEEAKESVKLGEHIKDAAGKKVATVRLRFTTQNVYRIDLEKLGGKKEPDLDKIVGKALAAELEAHLGEYDNDGRKAFSADGIAEFNDKRVRAGKHPVYSVKVLFAKSVGEDKLERIPRGYVKTGDNYCFAVLERNGQRQYSVLSLFDAAKAAQKAVKGGARKLEPIIRQEIVRQAPGAQLLFTLVQDDLVYLPIPGDTAMLPDGPDDDHYKDFWHDAQMQRWKRLFRVVKFTDGRCDFTPHYYAQPILYRKEQEGEQTADGKAAKAKEIWEYGSYKNCSPYLMNEGYIRSIQKKQADRERKKADKNFKGEPNTYKPISIQDTCLKVRIDRLGAVTQDF